MDNCLRLPECDDWLKRLYNRITPEAKTAFFWGFLLGMLIHLYMFTGKYPNHDEILNLYSANNAGGFGRWFLHWATFISSDSSVPMIAGTLSILALAGVCALTVQILHIQKRSQIILVALLMTGFPSVANTFTWMHVADGIFIALLFAVLGVYVTDRYKWGFLAGCVLFILSLMTYQSQICVAIGLFATRYLQLLLEKRSSDREMLLLLGRYAAALLCGVFLYILLARFILPALTGQEMFTHAGLDSMGTLPLQEIPTRIYSAYYQFAQYLLYTSMLVSWRFVRYLHLAIGALEVFLILFLLFRTKGKSPLQVVFALLILLMIPMLFTSIFLMGVTSLSTYYMLIYSIVLFYLLLLMLYNVLVLSCREKPFYRGTLLPNATSYLVSFMLLAIGVANAVNSNEVYLVLQLKYENSYALSNRVVASIEQYPGYTRDTPIYVAGAFSGGNYPPSKEVVFHSMSRHSGLQSASEYNLIGTDKLFRLFVRDYIGVLLTEAEPEQKEAVTASPALAQMPCYPQAGSLSMIDGVLVIKASQP